MEYCILILTSLFLLLRIWISLNPSASFYHLNHKYFLVNFGGFLFVKASRYLFNIVWSIFAWKNRNSSSILFNRFISVASSSILFVKIVILFRLLKMNTFQWSSYVSICKIWLKKQHCKVLCTKDVLYLYWWLYQRVLSDFPQYVMNTACRIMKYNFFSLMFRVPS